MLSDTVTGSNAYKEMTVLYKLSKREPQHQIQNI